MGDDVLGGGGFLKSLRDSAAFLRQIPTEIEMGFVNKLYPGGRSRRLRVRALGVLLIAAGMIVGMRISVSLLISSLVLYFGVGPG